MGIFIEKINNEYILYSTSTVLYNLTPYTNPDNLNDIHYMIKIGILKKLNGLKLNKDYDLDYHIDFKIIETISSYTEYNDMNIYDINLESKNWSKYITVVRTNKLKDILC